MQFINTYFDLQQSANTFTQTQTFNEGLVVAATKDISSPNGNALRMQDSSGNITINPIAGKVIAFGNSSGLEVHGYLPVKMQEAGDFIQLAPTAKMFFDGGAQSVYWSETSDNNLRATVNNVDAMDIGDTALAIKVATSVETATQDAAIGFDIRNTNGSSTTATAFLDFTTHGIDYDCRLIRDGAANGNFIIDNLGTGLTEIKQGGISGMHIQRGVTTTTETNLIVGRPSAIATNAADGFLYIPTCAGAPTGTPTAYTGKAAIVVDSTNHKLYFYDGAWRDAGP